MNYYADLSQTTQENSHNHLDTHALIKIV